MLGELAMASTAEETAKKKDAAKKIVNDFASRPTRPPPPFMYLSRTKVAAGALIRIDDPNQIAQMQTNLCGPASFVRIIASDDPETYAQSIVDLFEKGSATIGHGGARYNLRPGDDLRHYELPASAGIDQSDWIILASLRDSTNKWLTYSSVDDSVSALTMPGTMVNWLKDAGYHDVRENTNLASSPSISNAQDASNLFNNGYKVLLLINMQMLEKSTQDKNSTFPDHWATLTSSINFRDGNSLSFSVYTWGEKDRPVPLDGGSLATKSFLNNYYGYIACKY
jgi:hypothetical protein